MAWRSGENDRSFIAGADLSGYQNRLVGSTAAGTAMYVVECGTSTNVPLGSVVTSTADASGESLTVDCGSFIKVKTNANISSGDLVVCGASGMIVKQLASAQVAIGQSTTYAATGEIATIYRTTPCKLSGFATI